MKFRTTLVLAGVLVLVSLSYYFLEVKKAEEEAKKNLVSFKGDEVTAFSVSRGKQVIALKKGEGGWRMTQPVEDRVDEKEITALLENVSRGTIERSLKLEGENLDDFGLKEPRIILTVHVKDQADPFTVEMGSDTPAGFSVYARRNREDSVLVIPSTVKAPLEKEPFAFRSKAPLFLDKGAVKAVSLRTPSLRLRIERKEGVWRITDPIQAKADSLKVSNLFDALNQDQVTAFLDEPPSNMKSLGLEPPRGEITLSLEGGTEATLLLGVKKKKEGGVYARRGGEERVMVLKEDFLDELPKQVADIRNRSLLAVDREKVKQIELKSLKGRTLLAKDDDTWRMKEPEEALADQRVVEDLLWDTTSVRVKEFVSDDAKNLTPYGLDDPPVTLHLLDEEKNPMATVALSKVEKGAYARVGESNAIYLVEDKAYEQLDKGPFDLRFRTLLTFDLGDVGRMKLSRNGREILVERRKEDWEIRKPTQGKAKYSVVMDILNETKELKWQKIIAEKVDDLDRYGLKSPVATVGLTKADGKPIGTLLLGKEEGDLVYAKVQDKPQVYGIPSDFLQTLPEEAAALAE
ncbi:MAG: DUF4340 domain-containing protein [Candidatus Methylomirabilales bacterium]